MDLEKIYDLTALLFEEDPSFFDEARLLSMKSGEVSEVSFMYENDFMDEEDYETSLLDDGVSLIVIGMQMCHKADADMDAIDAEMEARLTLVQDELDRHDMRVALRNSGKYAEFAKFTGQTQNAEPITSEKLSELEDVMQKIYVCADTLKRLDSEPTEGQRQRIESGLSVLLDLKDDLPDDVEGPDVDGLVDDVRDFMETGKGNQDALVMVFEIVYDAMFDMAVKVYVYESHNLSPDDDRAFQ